MLQAGYRASAACARARPEHALVSGMFSGIPGRRPLNRAGISLPENPVYLAGMTCMFSRK